MELRGDKSLKSRLLCNVLVVCVWSSWSFSSPHLHFLQLSFWTHSGHLNSRYQVRQSEWHIVKQSRETRFFFYADASILAEPPFHFLQTYSVSIRASTEDPFVALDTFQSVSKLQRFSSGPALQNRGVFVPPQPLTSGRWVIVNPCAAGALRGPWPEEWKLKGWSKWVLAFGQMCWKYSENVNPSSALHFLNKKQTKNGFTLVSIFHKTLWKSS